MRIIKIKEIRVIYEQGIPEPTHKSIHATDIAVKVFLEEFGQDVNEVMGALYMDINNDVIYYVELARGEVNLLGLRLMSVIQPAILCNAVSIVLGHNHPAGDCTPSTEDINFTKEVRTLCKLHGFQLVDHIIVDRNGQFKSILRTESTS